MIIWNPWHGCHKVSEGCQHCYMYFLDRMRGIDTSRVTRNAGFDMPLRRGRDGKFKIAPGMELLVGLSTDFFVEEADAWRDEAWEVIRRRPDVVFRILTKRAGRILGHLPADWGDGYENVMLQVTTENQARADERLSILLDVPARHKGFMAAPLLGPVDAECYLASGQFEQVLCGGENYDGARPCHCEWVEGLGEQCRRHDVTFNFIETGTVFVKGGKVFRIPDKREQSRQAFLSGLSHQGRRPQFRLRHPEESLFDEPIALRTGEFRDTCATCGSRLTCNGCSNCGANTCKLDLAVRPMEATGSDMVATVAGGYENLRGANPVGGVESMAMPQRDDTIEAIKRLDALLEYAIMHGDEAEAERIRAELQKLISRL